MKGQKLKQKYEDSIFYEDMNMSMEVQIQRQAELTKEENKFTAALRALHQDHKPDEINAREKEMSDISDFLTKSILNRGSSESLYVSGVPGIGKTLCVKKVAQRLCKEYKAYYIYINALTVRRPMDIFKVIYYELTREKKEPSEALYQLDNYFEKGQKLSGFNEFEDQCKVLIIDEIDFLKTRDLEVLYSIFEWTQKKKSKLTIISISNTLDFPETLTGKIASRMGRRTICFKPYTSQQIQKILQERVEKLKVFAEQSLSFVCKKIAQCSSDIRKCLFILREAVATFLIENKGKNLTNKLISLDILARTYQRIYNDAFAQNFHEFPSAYKIVLYCLAKNNRNNANLCTMRQLQSLLGNFIKSRSQLIPILTDLRDLGIIKFVYSYFKSNDINSLTYTKFQNTKELKEQHIKLIIQYDRILSALQKQNLNEIKFNINLTF